MFPVPTEAPVQLPVSHLRVVPDPPVAVSVLLPPEQMIAGLADADVGATGPGLTVTTTFAHAVLTHPVVVFFARA